MESVRSVWWMAALLAAWTAEAGNAAARGGGWCYTVTEGASAGPTVVVVAAATDDGRAPRLAAKQIRHWPVARGKLVVAWPGARNPWPWTGSLQASEPHAAERNQHRIESPASLVGRFAPDWLLVLDESFDFRAKIPSSRGNTVFHAENPSAAEMARHLVKAIARAGPEDKEPWAPAAWSEEDNISAVSLSVVTASKHALKRPLWLRTRQLRLGIYALLARLNMNDKRLSAACMAPPKPFGADKGQKDSLSGSTAKNDGPHETRTAKASTPFSSPPEIPWQVAVYQGPGAVSSSGHDPTWIVRSLRDREGLAATLLGPDDIRDGALAHFDTVVFGGGSSRRQGQGLGPEGRLAVVQFVKQGGRYVGICAGAYLAGCGREEWLGLVDATMSGTSAGAVVTFDFLPAAGDWLGLVGSYPAKYSGGPILFRPAGRDDLPSYETLAVFKENLPGVSKPLADTPAIVASVCGRGACILFSPHCERAPGPMEAFYRAVHPGVK